MPYLAAVGSRYWQTQVVPDGGSGNLQKPHIRACCLSVSRLQTVPLGRYHCLSDSMSNPNRFSLWGFRATSTVVILFSPGSQNWVQAKGNFSATPVIPTIFVAFLDGLIPNFSTCCLFKTLILAPYQLKYPELLALARPGYVRRGFLSADHWQVFTMPSGRPEP